MVKFMVEGSWEELGWWIFEGGGLAEDGLGVVVEIMGTEFAGIFSERCYAGALLFCKCNGLYLLDHDLCNMAEAVRWRRTGLQLPSVKYQLGAVVALRGDEGVSHGFGDGRRACADRVWQACAVVAHIGQALSLGYFLEQKISIQATLLHALAEKTDGLIILGRLGAISFMNDAARAILAAGDGLTEVGVTFTTRRAGETRCLRRMIAEAIAIAPPSDIQLQSQMLVTRPSGERPYLVRVVRAPGTARFLSAVSGGCAIHLHDLAAVRLPEKCLLRKAFGLTEREADLVIELVRSANLSEAAENCSMAINTARNHLQSAFGKTATQHQAELVQLLGRMV